MNNLSIIYSIIILLQKNIFVSSPLKKNDAKLFPCIILGVLKLINIISNESFFINFNNKIIRFREF
jgi:hypothetical protein